MGFNGIGRILFLDQERICGGLSTYILYRHNHRRIAPLPTPLVFRLQNLNLQPEIVSSSFLGGPHL